jgi:hypothetical protein
MEEQLDTAWTIRQYLMEGLLANGAPGRDALTLLGVSSPLLSAIIPPPVIELRGEEELMYGDRTPLQHVGIMDDNLLPLGVGDARMPWPGLFKKATRYFMRTVPMVATGPDVYNVSERLDMDLYTGFTLKTHMSCEQFVEAFSAVRLVVGGQVFSSMPVALNVALARRAGLLVDQYMGVTAVPVMFPPAVFPVIASKWHTIVLEVVRNRGAPPPFAPDCILDVEGVVVGIETSHTLREGNVIARELGPGPPPPTRLDGSGFTTVDPSCGSFSADCCGGYKYARAEVPSNPGFPCTGFIVTVNLPPHLAHLIAPVKEVRVMADGGCVSRFDLVDMAERNWLKAGERGGRGNFELLVPFNRKGLAGNEVCTLNLGRFESTHLLFILGVPFSFTVTVSYFVLNIRRTGSGMSGHLFAS